MFFLRSRSLVFAAAACLAGAGFVIASNQPTLAQEQAKTVPYAPNLTEEQIRQFLLTAKVVKSRQSQKGVTQPYRLTLTDGTLTHDASFQAIDERKTMQQFGSGKTEMNFRDSYHFNIAGYELAKLIGLDQMVPIYIERKWSGKTGSISWMIKKKMDEGERLKAKIQPPDPDAWNKQMYRMRVFHQLICDTDPNLTNVLIGEDWKLWMIDFTRAFRLYHELENPKNLARIDRQLLEKLRQLDEAQLAEKTKGHLTKSEVKAVIARRDKIVVLFEQMVAQKGEGEVLY
jgi:hypothetical protein